jgi:hypothetical protein
MIERLREALFGPPQCGGTCLLRPGHSGFHKSSFHEWPNEADTIDWADVGRRIWLGDPSVGILSRVEMDYALAAWQIAGGHQCGCWERGQAYHTCPALYGQEAAPAGISPLEARAVDGDR